MPEYKRKLVAERDEQFCQNAAKGLADTGEDEETAKGIAVAEKNCQHKSSDKFDRGHRYDQSIVIEELAVKKSRVKKLAKSQAKHEKNDK